MLLIYEGKERKIIINFDNVISINARKIDKGDIEYSKHDGKKGAIDVNQLNDYVTTFKYTNYETAEQIANDIISANIADDDVYYFPNEDYKKED